MKILESRILAQRFSIGVVTVDSLVIDSLKSMLSLMRHITWQQLLSTAASGCFRLCLGCGFHPTSVNTLGRDEVFPRANALVWSGTEDERKHFEEREEDLKHGTPQPWVRATLKP